MRHKILTGILGLVLVGGLAGALGGGGDTPIASPGLTPDISLPAVGTSSAAPAAPRVDPNDVGKVLIGASPERAEGMPTGWPGWPRRRTARANGVELARTGRVLPS